MGGAASPSPPAKINDFSLFGHCIKAFLGIYFGCVLCIDKIGPKRDLSRQAIHTGNVYSFGMNLVKPVALLKYLLVRVLCITVLLL